MPNNTENFSRRLQELLGSMLPGVEAIDDYEALSGGITNRSYRVSAAGRHYVVRIPSAERDHVLDVSSEYRAMLLAAESGRAPMPVAFEPTSGVIVTEFRADAPHWSPIEARRQENIRRIAVMLRELHALTSDHLPPFEPLRIAQSYIESVAELGVLRRRMRALADELLDLARDFERRHEPTVFCHNDLVAPNILDSGDLLLVDFEYAARSAPILDLASLASMNEFDGGQRAVLLDAYFAGQEADFSASEFDAAVRMCGLLAHFWAKAMAYKTGNTTAYAQFVIDSGST